MSTNIGKQTISFFPPSGAARTLAGMGDESIGACARRTEGARTDSERSRGGREG